MATTFADLAWGPWLLVLLIGGGIYFLLSSRLLPFRYLPHSWDLIRGRLDDPDAPGHISHFKALSSALAGTIGMGNIAGVALAITIGGPGAVFWMWVTAIVGIATKFYTCTLAVMYRGPDSSGTLQGGPMYVIREACSRRWLPLAYVFAAVGLVGCLPVFQTNQLVQVVREVMLVPAGLLDPNADHFLFNLTFGGALAAVTAAVILGGITRIAGTAAKIVPLMSVLYVAGAVIALVLHADQVPAAFALILTDAFTGSAAASGGLLAVITYGVQRGAYSNEAGIGTEALAHGTAKTREPVREGLVAMLGPIVDTLLICTATALVLLVAGNWQSDETNGVTLTAASFGTLLGPAGTVLVFICVICFAVTTILTYSFYGSQCASFIFGAHRAKHYRMAFIAFVVVASVITLDTAIAIIDGAFALMAIPTMTSALFLAPRVHRAAKEYFATLR